MPPSATATATAPATATATAPATTLALVHRLFPAFTLTIKGKHRTCAFSVSPLMQLCGIMGIGVLFIWVVVLNFHFLIDILHEKQSKQEITIQIGTYEQQIHDLTNQRNTYRDQANTQKHRLQAMMSHVSEQEMGKLNALVKQFELESHVAALHGSLREKYNTQGGGDIDNQKLDYAFYVLQKTANDRDTLAQQVLDNELHISNLESELRSTRDRYNLVFDQIDRIASNTLNQLDKMFDTARVDTNRVLNIIQNQYSGQGGPLGPAPDSTNGQAIENDLLLDDQTSSYNDSQDALVKRSHHTLAILDTIYFYKLAADKIPFVHPLKTRYRFTSGYGKRRDPIDNKIRMHQGVDFAAPYGTPIYATIDGVITYAGWKAGFGKLVSIKNELGYSTYYGHLSKIHVKKGQSIKRGDKIGNMGSTGRSTGVHLHYEIRLHNKPLNPTRYMKAGKANETFF